VASPLNDESSSAPLLEVIVCTVADAIEAEAGGASRLEVISHFERGGLTPSLETVRAIQSAVRLPLRVMLRESDGFHVSGNDEVERLCSAARELNALRVDGIVLGFLRHGTIDFELTNLILSRAPALKATFHRAFDETDDPFQAIAELSRCRQIDRILTSGGAGDWTARIERLALYHQAAQGHPIILAGGGIDVSAIRMIRSRTGLTEFHTGSAARLATGPVQSALVKDLVRAVRLVH
jgi:copper homeostasis protein